MPDIQNIETILPPISSFEEIGIEDKFEFKHAGLNTQSTDLIPLVGRGNYVVACIKTPQPQGFADYYSVILFDKKQPIGHADFRIYSQKPTGARATHSIYPEVDIQTEGLPETISKAIPIISELSGANAVEISEEHKGERLGGLLWAIGCGFMEINGVREIYIDDTTTQKTGKSFYEHYGATFREEPRLVIGDSNLNTNIKQNLYASTHLNNDQQKIVKEAFKIN